MMDMTREIDISSPEEADEYMEMVYNTFLALDNTSYNLNIQPIVATIFSRVDDLPEPFMLEIASFMEYWYETNYEEKAVH